MVLLLGTGDAVCQQSQHPVDAYCLDFHEPHVSVIYHVQNEEVAQFAVGELASYRCQVLGL